MTESPKLGLPSIPLQMGATFSPKTRALDHPPPLWANNKMSNPPSASSIPDSNSSSSADEDSIFGEVTPADFDVMGVTVRNALLRGMGSPALGKVKLV